MMVGTVADVFFRYSFNKPLRISYDLVESMLVIYVFHGISGVFFKQRNIVIDVVDTFVSARTKNTLVVIGNILSLVALAILMRAMIGPALQAFDYGDRKIELGIPLYILWIFALVGTGGAITCAFAKLLSHDKANEAGPKP